MSATSTHLARAENTTRSGADLLHAMAYVRECNLKALVEGQKYEEERCGTVACKSVYRRVYLNVGGPSPEHQYTRYQSQRVLAATRSWRT